MIKTTILVPMNFNDGSAVPTNLIDHILSEIANFFGGYTLDGQTKGVYRMTDGSFATDICQKVIIGIDENQIPQVREVAGNIAKALKQETLYLEIDDNAKIEFIAPPVEKARLDYFGGSPGKSNIVIAA